MNTPEPPKKTTIIEKISAIMIIPNILIISITSLMQIIFDSDPITFFTPLQGFSIACLLIFLGIRSLRKHKLFALLFLFAGISSFIATLKYLPDLGQRTF